MATKHAPPPSTKSESKAESTNSAVKAIIDRETAARAAKTERLRAARLEREALESNAETPAEERKTSSGKRTEP